MGHYEEVESAVYRFDDFGLVLTVHSPYARSVAVIEFVFGDWWYFLFQFMDILGETRRMPSRTVA